MARFLAIASLVVGALGGAPALAKSRVVLFPVVPIPGEADAKSARDMTDAMLEELKRVDDIEVVLGKDAVTAVTSEVGRRPARSEEAYRTALKDLAEGAKQAQRLRFPQAIKALSDGIAGLEKNLDMLDDYQKLLDAYVLLAVAHFRRGQEAQGVSVLEKVARLSPELKLDATQYPPVFLTTFDEAKDRALARARGAIRVTSAPPGARVSLNGKALGTTPLYIDNVLPGDNHLVVKGGDAAWGQVVTVSEAGVAEMHANLGAGGPDAPVTLGDAIAANRFDRDVRQTARRLGRDQGGDWVILGAMGKGKGVLAVGLVMGNARTGKWTALSPLAPDVDMLSASIEAHNLAKDVRAKMGAFAGDLSDEAVPLIAGKPMKSGTRGEGLREQRVAFVSESLTSSRASGRAPVAATRREGTPVVALDGSSADAPEGSRAPVTKVERTPAITPPPPVPADLTAPSKPEQPTSVAEASTGRLPARRAEASAPKVPERSQVAKRDDGKRSGKKVGASADDELGELPPLTPIRGGGKGGRAQDKRGPVVRGKTDIEEVAAVPMLSDRQVAALDTGAGGTGPLARSQPVDLSAEVGEEDSVFKKWWFWTAVGAGVAVVGGGSYLLLANREPTSGAMYVVWK